MDAGIRGVGMTTPLGVDAATTWRALLDGKALANHGIVPTDTPAGSARATHLARLAVADALADAGWTDRLLAADDTALIVGTSKGAIVDWIASAPDRDLPPNAAGGPAPTGLGSVAADLAAHWRMSGPRLTISAACASGLGALVRAALMIRAGHARRALVVATEASVHPLFLGSFGRLGVLADPDFGCRPFDRQRQGFLMSEAAAAICLEPADTGLRIDRCALGGDAHHLTGTDPCGGMLRRLLRAAVAGHPMDLVHAHATGTPAHDPIELGAIGDVAGDPRHPPILYAHKGALGHALGAAGLLATAINALCHRHGIVPGNVRTADPLPIGPLRLSQYPQRRPIRRSLALAAGFGGAAAAVSLSSS